MVDNKDFDCALPGWSLKPSCSCKAVKMDVSAALAVERPSLDRYDEPASFVHLRWMSKVPAIPVFFLPRPAL